MRIYLKQADSSLRKAAARVRDVDIMSGEVPPSVGHDVSKLWADDGIQKTWEKKVLIYIYIIRTMVRWGKWSPRKGGGFLAVPGAMFVR